MLWKALIYVVVNLQAGRYEEQQETSYAIHHAERYQCHTPTCSCATENCENWNGRSLGVNYFKNFI